MKRKLDITLRLLFFFFITLTLGDALYDSILFSGKTKIIYGYVNDYRNTTKGRCKVEYSYTHKGIDYRGNALLSYEFCSTQYHEGAKVKIKISLKNPSRSYLE